MTTVTQRVAIPDDCEFLNRVKREASLASDEYRQSLLDHPELLTVPEDQVRAGKVLIAENEGEIVGLVAIGERDGGLELEGLFVDPAFWKRGIGRSLVTGAAAHFAGNAGATMHVVASPEAKAFYQACGFRAVAPVETRFGPAIFMRRDEGQQQT